MQGLTSKTISSGIPSLDKLLQGLHLGDNVVWQVDHLEDYSYFAQAFADEVISRGVDCIYMHFSPNQSILKKQHGLTITTIDPSLGFDYFSGIWVQSRRPLMNEIGIGNFMTALEGVGDNINFSFTHEKDIPKLAYAFFADNYPHFLV